MKYNEQALQVISDTAILPIEDFETLRELSPELQDTWQKRQIWRTETEMRVSVLNDIKHPTKASKYWQAVREQAVFTDQLVHLCYEYRIKEAEKEVFIEEAKELEAEGTPKTFAQSKIKRIEADRIDYILKDMQLAAKDRLREIKLWSKIKSELDDGTFDTKNVNTHQLESYQKQFALEAKIAEQSKASPSEMRNIFGKHLTTERVSNEIQGRLHD